MSIRKQTGVTLIELLVGMVIGLAVVGVVAAVYVNSGRNFAQDQQIGRMQENARFAMRAIARDLEMIGFMGAMMLDPKEVMASVRDCTTSPDNENPVKCGSYFANSKLLMDSGDDCGPGTDSSPPGNWAYHVRNYVEVVKESSGSGAETKFTCIDEDDFQGATDILVIRRVAGQPLDAARADSDDDGDVFLRTNGDTGMLLDYDSTASVPSGLRDWRYLVQLYYIQDHFMDGGDQIPTLYRKTLNGATMDTETGGVAQGIEYVHVMFGVDAYSDGVPDYYKSAKSNPPPNAAELRNAVTAKIYVLARSIERGVLHTNDKTYQLGDVSKDFSGSPDRFYRRVFSTTVQIRNATNQNRLL